MKMWTFYAYVLGDVVMTIVPFSGNGLIEAKEYGRIAFGQKCLIIDVTNYHIDMDDTYHDGAFWYMGKDGIEHKREPVPSEEEMLEALQTETSSNTTNIASNTTAIDDILIMLLDSSTEETT